MSSCDSIASFDAIFALALRRRAIPDNMYVYTCGVRTFLFGTCMHINCEMNPLAICSPIHVKLWLALNTSNFRDKQKSFIVLKSVKTYQIYHWIL